mgnify:CR=1 FL=1
MKMKGVSVSSWIWVIGGVIIASIIIVFGVTMLAKFQERNQKIFSIESYENMVNRVTLVCSQSIGNVDYYRVRMPDVVRAVYPAKFVNDLPPDKVAEDIAQLRRAQGRYICMQFFDETTARCKDILNCEIDMTYIGTPSKKDSLADILARLQGQYSVHNYLVIINKTDTKHVDILAQKELVIS